MEYKIDMELPALIISIMCFAFSISARRKQYFFPKGIKNKLTNQHFVFIALLVSNILSSASSVIGVQLTHFNSPYLYVWQYFFHLLYFVFHTTLSFCFTLYIMNVNGTSIGRKKSFLIIFLIPYLVSELIVFTNVFTNFAFYMEGNVYHRGPLMPVLYGLGILYIVLGFVFFFKYKKAVSKSDSMAIASAIIFATVGIVVQAIFSNILVELFAEAVSISFLMLILEEKTGHLDVVTGARNRLAFADANRRLINSKQSYSIVLISISNLNGFEKLYNEKDIDHLLLMVTQYLTSVSNVQDMYYYKHNGFAIIIDDKSKTRVEQLEKRILERFERDWVMGNIDFDLNAIITHVNIPDHIKTTEDLDHILAVDFEDMWSGNRIIPYSELSVYQESVAIEKALRKALEENQLRVYYQPIWSVVEGKTIAAEALLRVDNDELRKLSPQVYIPIAEKSGLIDDIGYFVFEDVCKTLASEEIKNSSIQYIELNLSVYQFSNDDLIDKFEEIRKKYDISVDKINLEITETAETNEAIQVSDKIIKLHKLGYEFSLDDFGTGYSNLVRLINSDFKNIKIDKTILWKAVNSEKTATLMRGVISLIRSMGYNLVQEGVETKEVLDRVIKAGCNLIQGYYFSKPIPYDDFVKYLQNETTNV